MIEEGFKVIVKTRLESIDLGLCVFIVSNRINTRMLVMIYLQQRA